MAGDTTTHISMLARLSVQLTSFPSRAQVGNVASRSRRQKLTLAFPVALALNEQILPEGESVPAVSEQQEMTFIAQGGHKDVDPEAIIYADGDISSKIRVY